MKRTILIVDDERVNRRILAKLLENEYQVMQAADGQEALAILHENADTLSAVLLDIVMPVMDGYAVLRAIEQDPNLSKIPVIVSSQADGDEAEIKALSLGAQDFIAKPYKAKIIRRRLSNLIKLRETAALVNRAEKDDLTNLYNKHFFFEKVSECLRQNPEQQYDLFCLGIERFKLVNETFGFERGDALLCTIAKLIQSQPRPILAARFTADQFYLLVPHGEEDNASFLLPWYREINEFPINMDIKMNCGIYEIVDLNQPVSVMCDRAQLAAEKNKGMYDRTFCRYDNSMRQRLLEEQFIVSNMRTALEQQQFQVYYQPKYELKYECVAGAEALVRWIHPERGLLPPDNFIPIFERNGFIAELDQYVWECACRDLRRWIDQGLPAVAVSVNVSRADIYNPHLSEILLNLLEKYRIPIEYLHLEITESAYTDNPAQIILAVGNLRKLGFSIEMDDFGSGYSSLNMLAEMPVDVLKLDMHFIQNETRKASGKGILSFVISLAKWLNLAVVAEGVETEEQIAALRSMDCNYVQGYYYAKPMQVDAFETLLKTVETIDVVCNKKMDWLPEAKLRETAGTALGRTILLVDDTELNRTVLNSVLSPEYPIVEKENGSEAWIYLNEHWQTVAVVVLDLLMPVMDGFQLMEKIRSDPRMRYLPVILTSQGDKQSEQRVRRMHADAFLAKPYDPETVKRCVHSVLDLYRQGTAEGGNAASVLRAFETLELLKPHFDLVRLIDPENMLVYQGRDVDAEQHHSCHAVWGKAVRCTDCISLKSWNDHGRHCKLERTQSGLHAVVSEYVPFGETGAILEMVTNLADEPADAASSEMMPPANPTDTGA